MAGAVRRGTPGGAGRLVAVAVALVLTGCGGAGPAGQPAPAAGEGSFPVTIRAANGEVRIPRQPGRIVSLSPTATEMLFAIGAGGLVVAADSFSNHPPEAPDTDLSGLEPNVEALAELDPDLVVMSIDPGDVEASLGALGIPALLHPAAERLEDTYEQIEQLGAATGHRRGAAELVASMRSDIDRLVRDLPEAAAGSTYYHELDQTFFTVTSETFIGQVYGLLGLRSIADEAEGGAPGYPQLSAEFILEADPDLIFLADTKCCGVTAESVAERPGWSHLTAVRRGAVVELDDDVASRWGPRIVDFLRTVAGAVSRLEPAAA